MGCSAGRPETRDSPPTRPGRAWQAGVALFPSPQLSERSLRLLQVGRCGLALPLDPRVVQWLGELGEGRSFVLRQLVHLNLCTAEVLEQERREVAYAATTDLRLTHRVPEHDLLVLWGELVEPRLVRDHDARLID